MNDHNKELKSGADSRLDTQTVMLLITEACNLDCVYCYERAKTARSMSEEMIRQIIAQHMSQARFEAVSFDFFGGEPLLEFRTIRNVVDWFHQQSWSKKHRFTMSTNGTLFNAENKAWFAAHSQCVIPMMSLDGTKKTHDATRCGSYDSVVQHIPFLRENWPTQPVRITIGPQGIHDLAQGVKEVHALDVPVEVGLVFENVWGTPTEKENYLKVYERELASLVEFYDLHPELDAPMILSRRIEGLLMAPDPKRPYCGAGEYMVCYTPDGSTYPCHRFTPLCSNHPCQILDTESLPDRQDACSACQLLPICPTCQGYNLEDQGHVRHRTTYHCDFFKLEVAASARLLIRRIGKKINQGMLSDVEAADLSRQLLGIRKLLEMAPA